jgi:predicted benzoate:H+ symporter BenE
MIDSVRLCLLVMFLVVGLIYTGDVIRYSRQATNIHPEWKGRIWVLGILGVVGYAAFMLSVWFRYYIPQLERWSTQLLVIMAIGIPIGIAHRILLRRILR